MPPTADAASSAAGQGGTDNSLNDPILGLDIDQLSQTPVNVPSMDLPVTTVTKELSTVGRSAAAVFVITQEMIRQSGVTNIPDALRMAPGVEVMQINSNTWFALPSVVSPSVRITTNCSCWLMAAPSITPILPASTGTPQDLLLEDIDPHRSHSRTGRDSLGVPTPLTASSTSSPNRPRTPSGHPI